METNNLHYYELFRAVPEEAKKTIGAGRLKGFTDINPMWRIKKLTETFGMVGIGWYYDVIKQWVDDGSDGQKVANTNIHLYVKVDGEWSKPIFGTGGSMFVVNESRGAYTTDEHFKMSLTDSLSGACKVLGIGADVYFEKDRTKYDVSGNEDSASKTKKAKSIDEAIADMIGCKNMSEVTTCWNENPSHQTDASFIEACKSVQLEIKKNT